MNTLPARDRLQTLLELDVIAGAERSEKELETAPAFIGGFLHDIEAQVRVATAVDRLHALRLIERIRPTRYSRHLGDRRYRLTPNGHDIWQQLFRDVADHQAWAFHHLNQRARNLPWFETAATALHPTLFAVYASTRLSETDRWIENTFQLSPILRQRFLDSATAVMDSHSCQSPHHTVHDILDTDVGKTCVTILPHRQTIMNTRKPTAIGQPRVISYYFGDVRVPKNTPCSVAQTNTTPTVTDSIRHHPIHSPMQSRRLIHPATTPRGPRAPGSSQGFQVTLRANTLPASHTYSVCRETDATTSGF